MAFETGLEGKPWYFGAIVGGIIAIALFVAAHMLLFKDMNRELERKETRLAELQTKIQEGRAARRKLPEFREEVRRLELELEKLLRILPSRRNTPELLRRIRELTEQGDFNLLRFTPGNFTDRDFFSEWSIAIALEGSYHNLARLFERVSRFSRIINVKNLRITPIRKQGSSHTIAASFSASTFVYREEEPVEQP